MPFDHSFPCWRDWFLCIFNSFLYHSHCSINPCFWEAILYLCIHFFQESLLSSFMFPSCQTLEHVIRPFIPFWGPWFLCILTIPFPSLFYWNLLFWPLSYWNLYFSLLFYCLSDPFPIEISTFWTLFIGISSFSTFWIPFYWNLYFLNTFLLKSLLSLYFSSEISPFSVLFYWNLLFLTTFPFEVSTFWTLFYWNLTFLPTSRLKSLLSEHFSIEIFSFCTFWIPFYWNLCFLKIFLLKSLLSFYFSIEISTFSFLFYWNLSAHFPIHISTFWTLFYCLFPSTFLLQSRLSEYFSIEISTFPSFLWISSFCPLSYWFWPLSYWNFCFLNTFLLKSPFSDHFPIEISSFWGSKKQINYFWDIFHCLVPDS